MRDIVFVAVIVGFFVLAAGFVSVCDRIIGPDPAPAPSTPGPDDRAVEQDLEVAR